MVNKQDQVVYTNPARKLDDVAKYVLKAVIQKNQVKSWIATRFAARADNFATAD